jgi:ABC-type glycerol-3-phosphate transport system substrate-binding protein
MKIRLTAIALVIAFLGAFVAAPLATNAAPPSRGTGTVTFFGTATDGTVVEGAVTGLTATVNEATGGVDLTGTIAGFGEFTAPLLGATQENCDILFLDLGPLTLDLLGLEVNLSQIILDINAVPGPGNLLGNLLCAVAGLLDGGNASGNAIANLLNRLLGLLG